MVWISVMMLTTLCVVAYAITKDYFSSAFIFPAFWLAIVFGSVFHLFQLDSVSDQIYFIVTLGCTFFVAGSLIFSKIRIQYSKDRVGSVFKKSISKKESFVWDNKVAVVLLFISVAIVLYKVYVMSSVLFTQGIGAARYSTDASIKLSGLALIIELYFAKPYLRCFLILFSIDTFRTRIMKKNIIAIFLLIVLSFLEDGGRSVLLYELFSLYYLYKYYGKEISKAMSRRIRLFVVIVSAVFIFATIERGSEVLNGFYTYYCGSLVYFTNSIKTFLFNKATYGASSFQGILRPIYGILNAIGIKDSPLLAEADKFLMGVQYHVVWITPQNKMNYFITCFGYFYKDLGYMGIVLFSILYGAICGKFDQRLHFHEGEQFSLAVKILMIQGILFSMSIFCFASFNYVMTLVYLCFVSYIANGIGIRCRVVASHKDNV